MKPAAFTYMRPQSTDEAVEMLGRYAGEAKLLAGGQSLMPMMNLRLALPPQLVDLNPLGELQYVRREAATVSIGAMTRQRALEHSATVRDDLPLLGAALPHVGHWQIRNRGTIGGSLAHADPAAELPTVAVALEAEVVARGPNGSRKITAEELFSTYLTTTLEPDEVLTEVRVPVQQEGSGWSFQEVARRHGDFALVLVAALVEVEDGRVNRVRLVLGGISDRPLRASTVEAQLQGERATNASVAAALSSLDEEIAPPDDLHASMLYRRRVARALATAALEEALGRAAST